MVEIVKVEWVETYFKCISTVSYARRWSDQV